MTTMITIWEGRRGPRGKTRRSRIAFGLRQGKKVTFDGELIGFWSDGRFAHQGGVEYSVFRTSGGIVIHRVRRSAWTAADDVGKFYIFSDLDAATARFRDVLKQAGVI